MPNTTAENQLAKRVASEIHRIYQPYLQGNQLMQTLLAADDRTLQHYVRFYDSQAFMMNLMVFDGQPQGCQVNGFTDRAGKPLEVANASDSSAPVRGHMKHAVVYLNRAHATPGTVVHELLHALSHADWYLYCMFRQSKNPNEAVTEYLTRKVIRKTNDDELQAVQRASYEDDVQKFGQAKAQAKAARGSVTNDVKVAYFTGQISANFGEIVDLFGMKELGALTQFARSGRRNKYGT